MHGLHISHTWWCIFQHKYSIQHNTDTAWVCMCGNICIPSVNINAWVRLPVSSAVWEGTVPFKHGEIMCFSCSSGSNADTLRSVYWSQSTTQPVQTLYNVFVALEEKTSDDVTQVIWLKILELCSFRLDIQCFKRSGHLWGRLECVLILYSPKSQSHCLSGLYNLYSDTVVWEM